MNEEERNIFVEWLRREKAGNDSLVKQMEKIDSQRELINGLKLESWAYAIVADRLHEESE